MKYFEKHVKNESFEFHSKLKQFIKTMPHFVANMKITESSE